MADGSIVIDTEIDESGFEAGTKDMQRAIKSLNSKLSSLGPILKKALAGNAEAMKEFETKAEELRNDISNVSTEMEHLGEARLPTERYKVLQAQVAQTEQALIRLVRRQDKLKATGVKENSRQWQSLQYDIDQAERKLESFNREMDEMVDNGTAFTFGSDDASFSQMQGEVEKVTQGLDGMTEAAAGFASVAGPEFSVIISALGRIAKAALKAAKAIGSMIVKGIKTMAGWVKSLSSSMLSLTKSSDKTNKSFKKAMNTLLKYGLGVRSFYFLFKKLRTAVIEGYQSLVQYDDTVNSSISAVVSSLTRLKNEFAAAFAPLVNVVAPILANFINMLSTAIEYIGMFVAMITGNSTYIRAKEVTEDYAASLNDASSSADDATDSVKALKRQLAGFDELNILSDTSSSGSSTSGTDVSDLFETVELPDIWNFDSWGEAFDTFLDYLLNTGIPALKKALKKVSNVVNTFSENVYEMLTFENVQDKIKLLGSSIADALNDFVNDIQWDTLGKALGMGLESAFQFMTSFVYNFNWSNLGSSLATLVNNAIATIDWENVGALLWSKFKILIETLGGFLADLDTANVAAALSDTLIGLIDSAVDTITSVEWERIGQKLQALVINIKWSELGTSLATAMNSIVTSFAKLDIGTTLGEAIRGFFRLAIDWASTFSWTDLGVTVGTAVGDVIAKVDWEEAGDAINTFLTGLADALVAFCDTVPWVQVGDAIGDVLAGIDWLTIMGKVAEAILTALLSALAGLLGRDIPDTMQKNVYDNAIKGVDDEKAAEVATEYAQSIARNAGAFAVAAPSMVWSLGEGLVNEAKESDISDNLVDALVNPITESTKFYEAGEDTVEGLTNGITDSMSTVDTVIANLVYDGLISGLEDPLEINSPSKYSYRIGEYLVLGLTNGVADSWADLVELLGSNVGILGGVIQDGWDDIDTDTTTSWGSIRDNITTKISEAKSKLKTLLGGIQGDVFDTNSDIDSDTSDTWKAVYESMSGSMSDAESAALTALNSIDYSSLTTNAGITSDMTTSWGKVKDCIIANMSAAESSQASAWSGISSAASSGCTATYTAVNNGFGNIASSMSSNMATAMNAIKNMSWSSVGTNICTGIQTGINNGWTALKTTVTNLANNLLTAAKNALGISSPSRRFRDEVGWYTGEGWANGIEDAEDLILSTVSGVADAMLEECQNAEQGQLSITAVTDDAEFAVSSFSSTILTGITDLVGTLQKIADNVTFEIPDIATQSTLPYQVAAKANATDFADITDAIRETGDTSSTLIVQAISNALVTLVDTIQNIDTTVNVDKNSIAEATIEEINRRTRMMGSSPLLG